MDWEKSEKVTAGIYGRKTSASGSRAEDKLDIIGEGRFFGWRIENKYTDKESYSLKTKVLKKMRSQAKSMMCSAFLLLDFGGRERYVILEEEDFLSLFDGKEQ
jgi:hypothetical protein